MQLDRAIDARRQGPIGIRNVDLGKQRPCAWLQRIRDPDHLTRERAVRDFRHAHVGFYAGTQAECPVLGHKHLNADNLGLHGREHEGSARRVGLHERAHGDVALGDNPSNGATTV